MSPLSGEIIDDFVFLLLKMKIYNKSLANEADVKTKPMVQII